ncbi:type IV pilus biogenesis protein PilM [Ammoniphilus sp. YIM 78166]|uniref:type IV pilus biogenesis protein PilM n=1 Tax=Ammoniphilus sp. YIM 78166 TaxID=1644106 RepID=UPI00107000B2|nr:pilus assembly protein PilM [Ammoniphilus sp. YIM 78166]
MKWNLWKRTEYMVGVEVKDSVIKFVEMAKSAKEITLSSYCMENIPEGLISVGKIQRQQDFSDFLFEIKNKAGIQGKNIQLSISSHHILLRPIRIPNLPNKELAKAVSLEIENSIQLPFEEYVFDFGVITEQDKRSEAKELDLMLVIAPKSYIYPYADAFKKAGFYPESVDLASFAVHRVIQREESLGDTYMLVNIGEKSTEVSIFHQKVPRLVRTFNLDLGSYINNLPVFSDNHSAVHSFARDMGNELERVMNFYLYTLNNREQILAELVLVGDTKDLGEISEYLSSRLGVRSWVAGIGRIPFAQELNEKSLREIEASLVVPLGMALKEEMA